MRKGDLTKQRIIKQAAVLLNQRGYYAASMTDIMESTGLKKGGIYNHFGSKEELALQAFEHNAKELAARFAQVRERESDPIRTMIGYVQVGLDLYEGRPIPGGCAIMNAAIEADDAFPELRERALGAMKKLRSMMVHTLGEGIKKGVVRSDANPAEIADVIISLMEGALMVSRLQLDPAPLQAAIAHIRRFLESDVREG